MVRDLCGECPARGQESWLQADRPHRCWPFDPSDGMRRTRGVPGLEDGLRVCVHPDRSGGTVTLRGAEMPPQAL